MVKITIDLTDTLTRVQNEAKEAAKPKTPRPPKRKAKKDSRSEELTMRYCGVYRGITGVGKEKKGRWVS
jgi:hypothetical protein